MLNTLKNSNFPFYIIYNYKVIILNVQINEFKRESQFCLSFPGIFPPNMLIPNNVYMYININRSKTFI